MAVMLMGLAFSAAQVESGAQTRRTDRKPAATANHRKPSGTVRPAPSRPAPSRPAVKPGSQNRPIGVTRPGGQPAGKPDSRPVRPDMKPGGGHKPGGGPVAKPPGTRPRPPYPGYGPGPRPGYGPGPRPPKPPKPVIVTRPIYGSIIAAAVASQLVRRAVRAASRPIYYRVEASGLRLSHSYVSQGTEYYYQDGVFYIIDAYGQYKTIIPPTGALVEYLPDDYVRFRHGSETYFRVDDTVYALTLIDGNPYFEVLGQL